jgi:LPS export ABC transporter protein LptC
MARGARFFASALALGLVLASPTVASFARAAETASVLRLTGITFVGGVNALVTEEGGERSFSMTCERAELNIETNDFSAEGDVQGETGDGQRYWAPWVRYDHEEGLLYTDAPVRLVDAAGTFRGDGFRYHIRERRFRLLENVRVEQIQ